MKSETIYISESTDFNNLNISKDVFKLTCYWANNIITEQFLWDSLSFVSSIVKDLKALRILDLSNLYGFKQFILDGTNCKTLYRLYLPLSVESVIFDNSETIREVRAMGVKSIEICDAPNLRNVKYGNDIEWLCLDNTGISHISLISAIKLNHISFKNCKNLKTIDIPSNVYIGSGTFEGCDNLEEVSLPNNMLVLEPCVFKNCKNLRFIKGGKSIKQLFPSAIEGCTKLEYIESVDFLKFTDVNISDKQWFDRKKFCCQRIFNLNDKYNLDYNINDTLTYAKELKKRDIVNPQDFFRKNFFLFSKKKHIGILLHYIVNASTWIIWSLNHHRYFISKRIQGKRFEFRKGKLIEFEYDDTPNIIIEKGIYIQRPITRVDLLSVKMLSFCNEYQDIIDYYNPSESFYKKYCSIEKMVNGLDITSIINSYNIETSTGWQRRPGRDDFEWDIRIAKSNYSDAYIGKLLPQEDIRDYSSGCAPWEAEHESQKSTNQMQELANKEASKLKEKAFENYSKNEHILTLLEEFVKMRADLEKSVENKHHINAITDFVKGFHLYKYNDNPAQLEKLYGVNFDDILNAQHRKIWND